MKDLARKLLHYSLRLVPFSLRGQIKSIPGIGNLQRLAVSYALDGSTFRYTVDAGPAKGITFKIGLPDDKGIWTGTYEIALSKRLASAIQPGVVAYDIGSWHGFFAGVMAANGARATYVFEPLPSNAERIRSLIELNPAHFISLHNCAVGDRETDMDLLVMPESSMAKLECSSFQAQHDSSERLRVKVRSIDAMVYSREIEPPGLIKLDVEGAELLVLKGAFDTIRRYRPVIFAEIHSNLLLGQCQFLLSSMGYSVELIGVSSPADHHGDVYQIQAVPDLPT